MAMINAGVEGRVAEVIDFYRLALTIKKRNLLPNEMRFSGGNDISSMYIVMKPEFVGAVEDAEPRIRRALSELTEDWVQ